MSKLTHEKLLESKQNFDYYLENERPVEASDE
jgi:hypothetical protein